MTTTDSLTIDRLRSALTYDPLSGQFHWLKASGRVKVGDVAGWLHTSGYWFIRLWGQAYGAHRLAWFHVRGTWPRGEIDHRNGCPTDNRIKNLRDVPTLINHQNQRRAHRDSKTGVLGVCRYGNRFTSCIHANGRQVHLGSFKTAEEASAAYLNAKRALHPGNTL